MEEPNSIPNGVERDRYELIEYIKFLFNIDRLTPKIECQIDNYRRDYNFSYSGILRSLIYFYDIKQHTIELANEGIGIVPYIYDEAYRYYYNIWLQDQKNANKNIKDYIPVTQEIHIMTPQRKPKKKKRFCFLDDEVEE